MNPTTPVLPACFALLDDSTASADAPRSRLYTDYIRSLPCRDAGQLPLVFADLQQALAAGLHAVALFSYEIGAELHAIAPRTQDSPFLSQILLFGHCRHLSAGQVDLWLGEHDAAAGDQSPAGIANLRPGVTESQFDAALNRIHAYLEAGDTYQVNYTYRLHFDVFGEPLALYRRLRQRQPVPYGALIYLPGGGAVLSLSPELFVQHRQGVLTVCPMKGTAEASADDERNALQAAALAQDVKNRAENLMIVDLLRNDLGRLAVTGSVQASELFAVQRFGNVLQMTSTVQAQVSDTVDLAGIFKALYPCGSITGAPKRRTMEIIRELEPDPRALYTGAIGWFDAPLAGRTLGDFCWSVPIRTLLLQAPVEGVRAGQMGVGAGIVHDSVSHEEYAECRLKAGFLAGLQHDFSLFETIHASRADGCRHLDLHLQRLQASARYFSFQYDEASLRTALDQACAALPSDGAYRMRLALDQAGGCSIQSGLLTPLQEPVRLLLASEPTRADELFLRHKTTVRQRYDAAWRTAEQQGAFDMLFFNTQGELTEGGRSSVFVKLDGRWYTPPLSCGVLPGVMRAVLLADPHWQASERRLTLQDLQAAQQVVVCNALRGALQAQVVDLN